MGAPWAAADPEVPPDPTAILDHASAELDVLHQACVSSEPPFVATGSCTGPVCREAPYPQDAPLRCEDVMSHVPPASL